MLATGSMLAAMAGTAVAQQSGCAPPAEMKAKLTGHADVEALNDLGVWFGEHQNYNCAAEVFATSLQTDPAQSDLSHVAFLFGASLFYTGSVSEGVTALREAERLGYRHIKLHTVLAQALEKQKDFDGAEAEWRRALEYEPESSEVIDAFSNDLLAAGKYEEEIALLEAPRVKPQRTPMQFINLAAAYEKTGRAREAGDTLTEALNTYPDSKEIARDLARLLHAQGREDESARVLRLMELLPAAK